MFAELTWLRPAALLLLLPLPLLYAALQRGSVARNPWAAHIDAGLLPALWPRAAQRRGLWPPRPRALLGSALWLLATLALAGPSWRSLPVPTQQAGAQSVIAFGPAHIISLWASSELPAFCVVRLKTSPSSLAVSTT